MTKRTDGDARRSGSALARVFATALVVASLASACGCCCSNLRPTARDVELKAFDPDQPNPLFVRTSNLEALWDAIVDTVDNYYDIEYEAPARAYERTGKDGATYQYRTEGRLDTKPSIVGGSTEPWRKNSAPCGEKCFATLQTVRSYAIVRVVPEGDGFFIYLSVYEEIEDMPRPMGATIGVDMRYDDDMSKLTQDVGVRRRSKGWIPIGRNAEQESRMLKEIGWRAGLSRGVLHEGVDAPLRP